MDAQGISPIGLASMVAPTTPRPLANKDSGRYRNDPYTAAVLPQLLLMPQPPVHSSTNPPPTHNHHMSSFYAPLASPSTSSSSFAPTRVPLPPVHVHHLHLPTASSSSTQLSLPTPHSSFRGTGGFASRVKEDVARAAAFTQDEDQQHQEPSTTPTSFAYIRFKHDSSCYKLPFPVRSGDYVVVEADRGINAGMVERVTFDAPSYAVHSQVVRFASHEEVMTLTCMRLEEREVLDYVQDMVQSFGLDMNVVDVEFQYDRRKLTIFFEAATTVDFRRLQRALFKQYSCRIWLVLWRDSHHHGQRGGSGGVARRLPVAPSSI